MSLEQVIAENTQAIMKLNDTMERFMSTASRAVQKKGKVETTPVAVKEKPKEEETKETTLSGDDLFANATKAASAYAKAFDVKSLVALMRDRYGGKAHIDSLSKEQQEDLISFCQKALDEKKED